MKNIHVLQLIASLCLLFGSVINLLNACAEIPFGVSVCSVPLLLAAIVLYCIVLKKHMKRKKGNDADADRADGNAENNRCV